MIIRKEQIQILEEIRLPEFEEYMVSHLKEFSPLHAGEMEERALRVYILGGMKRAGRHGLTSRGSVRFFIEAMLLLGTDFDTDPQYPWASDLLSDSSVPSALERASQLHAMLMNYLDAVGGPNREYAIHAIRRLKDELGELLDFPATGFENVMIRRMHKVYPEKTTFLGPETLHALISRASKDAYRFQITSSAGRCLFVGLAFMIGHGFVQDPMYPWVAETMARAASDDPDELVSRLRLKAMAYLAHVLHNLERTIANGAD